MATVNLTFNSPINISCKVGDQAYYVPTSDLGGFSVAGITSLIGVINTITDNGSTVIVNVELEGDDAESVSNTDFIFFSKNNLVEIYEKQIRFLKDAKEEKEIRADSLES